MCMLKGCPAPCAGMTFCLPLSWIVDRVEAWQRARKRAKDVRISQLNVLVHFNTTRCHKTTPGLADVPGALHVCSLGCS